MRIVFASLGSLGDLHPLLAVARAAEARGHETVIAASRGFGDYVRQLGFRFVAIRPNLDPEPSRVEYLSHPTRGPGRLLKEEIFGSVRETYADLLEATEGADLLVVGELLYVAPLVAEKQSIPWATAILSPSSFLSAKDPGVLAPVAWMHRLHKVSSIPHRVMLAIGRRVTRRWAAPLTELRKEKGLPEGPSPVFDGKFSPDLVLALFPEFFAKPQTDWPPAVVQTGFPFFEQPGDAATREKLDEFFARGQQPIAFTLGSSVVNFAKEFYTHAARAATDLGHRAILLTGSNRTPDDLPDSILAIRYAPLHWIFPKVRLAVHHGGVGSCGEAIRAGVPSLVIPFGYDQPDNAARLARLGVASVLPGRRFHSDRLRSTLAAAPADDSLAKSAKQLSQQLHAERELETTVDLLEKLARNTEPITFRSAAHL